MEDEALDNLKYRENSQGPFVRRPISAKPGVKFNPGFSLLCSKASLKHFLGKFSPLYLDLSIINL